MRHQTAIRIIGLPSDVCCIEILFLNRIVQPIEQLGKLLSAVDVQFLIRLSEIVIHRISGNAGILGDLLYGHAVGIFQDRLVFLYGKSVGAKRPLAGVDVNPRLRLESSVSI